MNMHTTPISPAARRKRIWKKVIAIHHTCQARWHTERKQPLHPPRAPKDREEIGPVDVISHAPEHTELERVERERLEALRQDLEISYEVFPHYVEQEFLANYAALHGQDLLAQREDIFADFREQLHRDTAFVAYLKEHAPHLYEWRKWQVYALAIAEQLAVKPPEPSLPALRPKLTQDERHRKIEQYRARMLERERVHAQDHIAKTRLRLDLLEEFRKSLTQYDLDEGERIQLEQEFLEKLYGEEEENGARTKTL